MDNIIEPSDEFDFSNLSLANPTGIQGGAYFTKIENNNKALYIQTPKSLTKQGFVKNGKKIVVDLMFNNNDEKFINWVENLETKCQELICEKGDSWFQNKLEISDIETAFASPLKVYKSGRYYLMRVNLKMNYVTNTPNVKIYDESESPLDISDINENTNIISILEVQGIKFTSRNFQIEIELKQAMVLNTEVLFDNCLIKTSLKKPTNLKHDPLVFKMMETTDNNFLEENTDKEEIDSNPVYIESEQSETLEETTAKTERDVNSVHFNSNDVFSDSKEVELHIEDLQVDNEEDNNDDLKEFDLNSNLSSLETITLKKPNQVYHEIYKAAREKAKKAKKEAIQAFLDAKNIKKTYMLDEIEDSDDSDMDFESI
uniref:Uncharacterized protein n=1 Tax=viral metagenome TaxID=1070528 RepID=A0A6C0KX67_9ZZZZ